MKLFYHPVAPNPARVWFYLNEKGDAASSVERVFVDIAQAEQRTPEFLQMNPRGVLPVLEMEDGSYLGESVAIIEYLEEKFPQPAMIGNNAEERAITRSRERDIEMNVLLRIVRLVHATKSPLGLPPNPAVAEAENKQLPSGLERVDSWLADGEFVMGIRPSIADCTLLAALNFAQFGEISISEEYEHLQRWMQLYPLRHISS